MQSQTEYIISLVADDDYDALEGNSNESMQAAMNPETWFENVNVTFTISFDKDMKLSGLYMK